MNKFNHWIFHSFNVSAESLGIYRIIFALFTIIAFTPGHAVYTQFDLLSNFPESFFDPAPGPMMLVGGIPGQTFFHGLLLALNISLVALLVGYRTFWASLATGVLLLTGFGFSYSLGKVNHTLLFLILPLVLMWSNWGAAYSWDAMQRPKITQKVESWPLTLLILFTGFMFFTAGFPKILGGWLSPDSLATRGHLFNQYFVSGRVDLMAGWFIAFEARWFWIMLDYLTIIFEVGFLIAVLHPVSIRIFLVLAVIFHTGTLMMLNIAFATNLIVYAAFVNWPGLLPRFGLPEISRNGKLILSKISPLIFIPLIGIMTYQWGSPIEFINRNMAFTSDLMFWEVLTVLCALAGTVIFYTYKLFITVTRQRALNRNGVSSNHQAEREISSK
ncbi:MAG: HTTM domain-containing protein [Balneolales bacterium]